AEMAEHTCVDELVTDAHGEPADQLGVDNHLQADCLAELPAERLGKPLLLPLVERPSRRDVRDQALTALGGELGELVKNPLDSAATWGEDRAFDECVGN